MKYIPTIQGCRWTTTTCSGNGNGGIHDQEQFKSGVLMLESAIDEWPNPILVHIILQGGTQATYSDFITRLTRYEPRCHFKHATEHSIARGHHMHLMLIVDSSQPQRLFDKVAKLTARIQGVNPEFSSFLAKPEYHHSTTPYRIPLSLSTLQDAACWLSYIFKARSKQPGHAYGSSRVRASVSKHRKQPVGLTVLSVPQNQLQRRCGWALSPFRRVIQSSQWQYSPNQNNGSRPHYRPDASQARYGWRP